MDRSSQELGIVLMLLLQCCQIVVDYSIFQVRIHTASPYVIFLVTYPGKGKQVKLPLHHSGPGKICGLLAKRILEAHY